MREVQLGSHTVKSHGLTVARAHLHDWLMLVLLILIEIILYTIHPFYRFVGKDMMTDLKYPFKSNTVPAWTVPVSVATWLWYRWNPSIITCKYIFRVMKLMRWLCVLFFWMIRSIQFFCLLLFFLSSISGEEMSMIFIMPY